MEFVPSGTPKNSKALGVLGYLIVVNKQVHSYQIDALTEYLNLIHLDINETSLNDIIEGKDESVSFATSLTTFLGEEENIQKDIYYMLVVLSCVDNSIDGNEQALIEQIMSASQVSKELAIEIKQTAMADADSIRSSQNLLFERKTNTKVKLNVFQKIINWIVCFFKMIFKKSDEKEEKASDVDYKSMIEKSAEVALEDFKVVKPSYSAVLDSAQKCMDQLDKYKRSLSLETGLSSEVSSIVKIFIETLNSNVLEQGKHAEQSLVQKERTITDFTISLVGRTKAGKSTLHAILTNQGHDKIGVGRQRTTRYNRVYQWNLLRLIDTPGIGSAEADGRSDDEIAESVLGESDVICFVVVDDSILKDVLEFIEKVAALNKPIIILLNHKENIVNDVKFRRYIEKPSDWLISEGESNIQGHINRIQKYANDKGFGPLVRVFPVFLLAAQMSGEEKYKEYSDLLWKSSNMDSFIEELKIWISSAGTIKRSQTILDEAIHIFNKFKEQIATAQGPVEKQINILIEQRAGKIQALQQAKELAIANVKSILEEKFDNMARNEALLFAEEVYNQKDDLSEKWKVYIERLDFVNEVKIAVEKELSMFSEKADETISDLFEDFYYSIKTSFQLGKIDVPLQLDLKSITRLAGSAIGVAGSIVILILGASNPVGWILTGAGILVGLGSLLFSSKEKKRQKAINKIYDTIKSSILEQAPTQVDYTIKEIDSELTKNIERIDSLFADFIKGLGETINISSKMTQAYDKEIEQINKVYAWRILNFLRQTSAEYSPEKVSSEVKSVDRAEKGVIKIKSEYGKGFYTDVLDGIIADKVKFI